MKKYFIILMFIVLPAVTFGQSAITYKVINALDSLTLSKNTTRKQVLPFRKGPVGAWMRQGANGYWYWDSTTVISSADTSLPTLHGSTGISVSGTRQSPIITNTSPNTVDTAMTRVYPGYGVLVTGTTAAYTIKADTSKLATQYDIANFITDGNTNWDNSYGFITDGNTNWDNSYGFITQDTLKTRIYGGTNIIVTGSAPNYTITSSDTSKTYINQGAGITVSGTAPVYTITNSAPNTVDTAMTRVYGGTGISVTGTTAGYTVTNTLPMRLDSLAWIHNTNRTFLRNENDKVGIGTNAPLYNVHVKSAGGDDVAIGAENDSPGKYVSIYLDNYNRKWIISNRLLTDTIGAAAISTGASLAYYYNGKRMATMDTLGTFYAKKVFINAAGYTNESDTRQLVVNGNSIFNVSKAGGYDTIYVKDNSSGEFRTAVKPVSLTWADTSNQLATDYNVALKQNIADTTTKDATRYWVTQQGYLTAEVDGSVTNEGQLSVSGNGANPSIVSNSSGSSTIGIQSGNSGIVVLGTESTDIISINNAGSTYVKKDGYSASGTMRRFLEVRDSTGIGIAVADDATNDRTIVTFTNTGTAPDSSGQYIPKYLIDAEGDLIVGDDNNVPKRLAKGTDGQVLKTVSGSLQWANDETGAGGTLTWSDTLAQLATDYYVLTHDTLKTRIYAGAGISVSGSAPAYTITNTAPSSGGTVTQVNAGNGMDFTAITGSGSVAMGTPGQITKTSTNAVSANSHTHGIDKAYADSSTMGIATFETADFTDGSGGIIGIDYVNGQAASASQKGFLTAADWGTFNGKLAAADTSNNVRKWIMDAEGDLIVGDDNNAYKKLARGSDGQVLKTISGALQWSTDETGAGGTLTWGDTLAQLATDYNVSLKQNIADTSTKDATRYWVGQQNYAPKTLVTPTANGLMTTPYLNLMLNDSLKWTYIERTGLVNRSETSIVFDSVTRILTLQKTGDSYSYFQGGRVFTKTTNDTSKLTPITEGMHYFYIDTDGVLKNSMNPWNLEDNKVPVCMVLWDNAKNHPYKFYIADERHSSMIDKRMQWYLHKTDGTQWLAGGLLSGWTANTAGNTGNTFGFSAVTIIDQDIEHTIPALADPNGTAGAYRKLYRTGASTWTWDTTAMPFSFTYGANYNYMQWDNAGTMQNGVNNRWYNTYVCWTNLNKGAKMFIISGQGEFTSAALAYAENPSTMTFTGIPVDELEFAYQITWNTAGVANSVRGRTRIDRVQRLGASLSGTTVTVASAVVNSTTPLIGDGSVGNPLTADTTTGAGVATQFDISGLLAKSDTSNNVRKHVIDAAGDLIVGTGNNTYDNLAKGTDGQVLKMSSGSVTWGTDETGAGGTLTWGDTLAQLATDYNVALKQNIADTSTKDATRYWVTQQGYDPSSTNEIQNLSYTASTRVMAIDGAGSSDATIPLFSTTSTDPGLVNGGADIATKFLRGDNTWQTVSASTSVDSIPFQRNADRGATFLRTGTDKVGFGTVDPTQQVELTGSMELPATTSTTTGVIYKGAVPWLHNYTETGTTGNNLFLGLRAGNFTYAGTGNQASFNTGIGDSALASVTSGQGSTAVGWAALSKNTSSNSSTAIGYNSQQKATGAALSTSLGASSLAENVTGDYNTAIGTLNLYAATGSKNTGLGYYSGAQTTGSNSIFLGYMAGYHETTASNMLVINSAEPVGASADRAGSWIYGTASNLRLGGNRTVTLTNTEAGTATDSLLMVEDGVVKSINATALPFVSIDSIPFQRNATRGATFLRTGTDKVCIGTTIPATSLTKLTLVGGDGDYEIFSLKSNNSSTATMMTLGRTSNDGLIGVAGVANNFWTGSASGDFIIRGVGGKLHLATGYTASGMTMDASGNVGIGTTAPTAKLEVSANNTSSSEEQLQLSGATNSNKRLRLGYNTTSNYGIIQATTVGTSWDNLVLNGSGGNVGIGTTSPGSQLHTTGTVRFANFGAGTATFDASGNLSSSSDENLKVLQGSYTKGMSAILNIQPINYKWNNLSGMETEHTYTGFSAQNVQANIPEAVGENEDGYLTLQDRAILATAINAIKELNAKILVLEAKVQALENK